MNLLEETIKDLDYFGYSYKEIVHIGNSEYGCTWEEFKSLADIEYDAEFGGQEIANDLKIIFKDGNFLYRYEYDGRESWAQSKTEVPKEYKQILKLKSEKYWESLEEIQNLELEKKSSISEFNYISRQKIIDTLEEVVSDTMQVFDFGAKKHPDSGDTPNFLTPEGNKSSLVVRGNSCLHHSADVRAGVEQDHESGLHPALHLIASAAILYIRQKRNIKHPED